MKSLDNSFNDSCVLLTSQFGAKERVWNRNLNGEMMTSCSMIENNI